MGLFLSQLRDLWSEKGRVGWVALGVAWGTLSLTLLVGFGSSFVRGANTTIENFGVNLLRIGGGATTRPHKGMSAGRPIRLRPEDEPWLQSQVPEAEAVALEYSSGSGNPVRYGEQQVNAPLSGCGSAFLELRGMIPQSGGRFINAMDVEQHRRVCFLGHRTKQRLFGDAAAVGALVEIDGAPFTVIGVRVPTVTVASYNGDDRDKVCIPHTTFRDLRGWTGISFLFVKLQDPDMKRRLIRSVYTALGARHGFDARDEDALDVQDYLAIQDMVNGMLDGNRYFNGIVGFFGLLVAMLGVMNVMHAMVEERSSEIGLCMALGATPRDVAQERVVEGLLVTLLGGALGLATCAGLMALIRQVPLEAEVRAYLGDPVLSMELGLVVVLILALAGCVAGWFPARRAAALDPISTLREE